MKRSPFYASCAVLAVLAAVGGALHLVQGGLHWGGFLAIAFFYTVVFYLGVSATQRGPVPIQEMLLAGRTLPLGTGLLTMTATWVGGGFINGTAESVSTSGLIWTQAPWGYAMSLVVGGLIFARPMRRHNFITLLDPLEDRFGRRMSGLLYIPAVLGEIFWTAAILAALGTTFGFLLGIDFSSSIILSALIAILYTSIGGLRAVARTDVFQLIILLAGLLVVVALVLPQGGPAKLYTDYSEAMGERARLFPSPEMGHSFFLWCDQALLLVFGGIPWHVYFQRVLSSRDEDAARWLSIGAGGLCLVAAVPPVLIGMISATTDWAAMGVEEPVPSVIALPHVLKHLAPPAIATLGLGALAAAVMSSVDSSILSASSMGVWNIYRPLFSRGDHPAGLDRIVRRLIWIVGIAATFLALRVQSVYTLWFLCSDLVYCVLFPQLVTALFDRKANAPGSLAGFVVAAALRLGAGEAALGLPTSIPYPLRDADGTLNFPFRSFAMLSGLITIVLVSRWTQKLAPARPLITREILSIRPEGCDAV